MIEQIKPAVDVPEPGSNEAAIQSLTALFGDAVKHLALTSESQQTAILALTAMMALSPHTAQIDPLRLGIVVQALTQNRKDGEQVRERIAAYVSAVVGIATKLPEFIAENADKVDPKSKKPN